MAKVTLYREMLISNLTLIKLKCCNKSESKKVRNIQKGFR